MTDGRVEPRVRALAEVKSEAFPRAVRIGAGPATGTPVGWTRTTAFTTAAYAAGPGAVSRSETATAAAIVRFMRDLSCTAFSVRERLSAAQDQ